MLEAIDGTAKTRGDQANLVHPKLSKSREPARVDLQAQQQDREVRAEETSRKAVEISQAMLDGLQQKISDMHQVGLRFSKHEETGRTLIRVIDKDTGELVREIPSADVLNLAARLNDMMGILFDEVV